MNLLIGMTMVSLMINSYVLWYIFNLEKNNCNCSITAHSKFIKYYAYVSIACNVALLLLFFNDSQHYLRYETIYLAIFVPSSIIHAYVVYKYVKESEHEVCECTSQVERSLLYILAIFISIIYSFGGIFLVLGTMGYLVAISKKR